MTNSESKQPLSLKQKQDLENIRNELKTVEKCLKIAIKLSKESWIINSIKLKAQSELGGIDFEKAFKNEFAKADIQKSEIQITIEKALEQTSNARSLLLDFEISANAK